MHARDFVFHHLKPVEWLLNYWLIVAYHRCSRGFRNAARPVCAHIYGIAFIFRHFVLIGHYLQFCCVLAMDERVCCFCGSAAWTSRARTVYRVSLGCHADGWPLKTIRAYYTHWRRYCERYCVRAYSTVAMNPCGFVCFLRSGGVNIVVSKDLGRLNSRNRSRENSTRIV